VQEYSEDEDDDALGYLDMGTSTGAWPFYLRLMFISGYRYVQSLDADTLPCDKQEVLDAILKCCPAHRHQVKNTFEGSCNNAYHSIYMSMYKRPSLGPIRGLLEESLGRDRLAAMDPFAGMFEAHDYFNESEVMSAKGRMYLGIVGLDPIAELAFARLVDFPPPVVRRVGEMFKTLKPFVPQTVEDLAGTPYDTTDECSLDNNGCVQLVKEMIPLFVKAAEFGDCVTEQY
jgi:hypothetical protein